MAEDFSDILKRVLSENNTDNDRDAKILSYLEDISSGISALNSMSQSSARDAFSGDPSNFFRNAFSDRNRSSLDPGHLGDFRRGNRKSKDSSFFGQMLDSMESEMIDGFLGSDFKGQVEDIFKNFAGDIGGDIKDIPSNMGKLLAKQSMTAFKNSKFGASVSDSISNLKDTALSKLQGGLGNLASKLNNSQTFANAASGLASKAGATVASMTGSATAGSALSSVLGAAAGPLGMMAGPIIGVIASKALGFVVDKIMKTIGPAIEGMKELFKSMKKAANRDQVSREQNMKYAQERLEADIRTMAEYPFEILKKAAEELYSNWEKNISTINQTQGYTKNDLMNLMSNLAERLRDEGLSSVISGTEITDALSQVLKSGLSGQIAEEFAYQAVKLNAAVPTQDFFSFADTYASVAANAVKNGQSQTSAIQAANESLYEFTNNVLYASRELTGGFTTGLKDASSLYSQATKIAQAARTDNANEIGSVLSSVAAVTGSIAPDLASSLTDAIYKAATGGNSSSIVALRSLSGVNASNTEFIRAFARNPKQIIATMFETLGNMYSQSEDAYMEKAEGYAELFGMSAEAFQRVDFNYLADQIANMNASSSSLSENLELLQSGQSTASIEQQKAAQINQYMIEQGLAYVIDNQAAQMIQEHMWDEQRKRELMENLYAVELKGSAAEALEGIRTTVSNIINFLNPLSWFKKAANLVASTVEAAAQEVDLRTMLEAGRVGNGSARDLYNLTNRNEDLHLAKSVNELFGTISTFDIAHAGTKLINAFGNPVLTRSKMIENGFQYMVDVVQHEAGNLFKGISDGVVSKYSWGGLTSKTTATAASNMLSYQTADIKNNFEKLAVSATDQAAANMKVKVDDMIGTIDSYVKDHKTYEEWAATASNYGISDFEGAIQEAGYTVRQLQDYFQTKETEEGIQEAQRLRVLEERMYNESHDFWTDTFWVNFNDPLKQSLVDVMDRQDLLQKTFDGYIESFDAMQKNWESHWNDYKSYYLDHNIYNGGSLKLKELQTVQSAEKAEKGDVVNKLSEYLTANDWNLDDFKDPQVQANALLSQILIVVNAIMNQNNEKVGTVSLADSLSALSMGMTTTI